MSVHALRAVILRDLRSLAREVEAYPDNETLWRAMPGVANAGGTLVLHLVGNLRHFIGAVLGGSGYLRDREAEFMRRALTRRELGLLVDKACRELEQAFDKLEGDALDKSFPEKVAGRSLDTDVFLVHLAAHLGYHLGQIDYHRRMVTADGRTVDMVAPAELPPAREAPATR